ncbi:Six-hairpin glycosidase-like protein [Aspergillus karnatakaensis]|uniref:glycoside hydrolase family 95 protein n=1 Tax=Aspergillus karnatakaensis TaxID=1810916 RepID=UPI003CCDE4C8
MDYPSQHTLHYTEPASTWSQALPIGNGRLGAMIKGTTDIDRLWINEDSVWYGGPQNRTNPAAKEGLKEVQRLLAENQVKAAEELAARTLTSMPRGMRHYEPLGDVFLDFGHGGNNVDSSLEFAGIPDFTRKLGGGQVTDYTRELDISTGVAGTNYTFNDVSFKREYFSSVVDEVICVRVSADREESLNFKIKIHRGSHDDPHRELHGLYDTLESIGDGLLLKAKLGGEGALTAAMGLFVILEGQGRILEGEEIEVVNADSAVIVIAGETTFRNQDAGLAVRSRLEQALQQSWDGLRDRHITGFSEYYSRVSFALADSEPCSLPVPERLARFKSGEPDNGLIVLLVNYARYLLISSSLSGLPANLQGIWNPDFQPVWGSKYTININLQMNYWPAEVFNLPECHQVLFNLIERLSVTGKKTAQDIYGCNGFVAHHNTDIWADSSPQDRWVPASYWRLGGAWLSLHLWEHYLFTKDLEFLKWAYPILRDAATFFEESLTEHNGHLVVSPSVSCENSYYIPDTDNKETAAFSIGSTWDSQILHELFSACAESSTLLNHSPEISQKYQSLLSRLPPPQVGKHGQLQEWLVDYDEPEPGHRHISHAFGLFPGTSIKSPQLKDAIKVTLQRRLASGGGHTGWSAAWLLCLYARLQEPEAAYNMLSQMISHSILPNLFCDHPPFQIDGNFGLAAGVAEMVLQSQAGVLVLLPALPKAWEMGGLAKGLCARGGWIVDVEWRDGVLVEVRVEARRGAGGGEVKLVIERNRLKGGESEVSLVLEEGESSVLGSEWLGR